MIIQYFLLHFYRTSIGLPFKYRKKYRQEKLLPAVLQNM